MASVRADPVFGYQFIYFIREDFQANNVGSEPINGAIFLSSLRFCIVTGQKQLCFYNAYGKFRWFLMKIYK